MQHLRFLAMLGIKMQFVHHHTRRNSAQKTQKLGIKMQFGQGRRNSSPSPRMAHPSPSTNLISFMKLPMPIASSCPILCSHWNRLDLILQLSNWNNIEMSITMYKEYTTEKHYFSNSSSNNSNPRSKYVQWRKEVDGRASTLQCSLFMMYTALRSLYEIEITYEISIGQISAHFLVFKYTMLRLKLSCAVFD